MLLSVGFLLPLPSEFAVCLFFYFSITITYSFFFKRLLFLDVILLACLYVLRIVSGALTLSLPLSHWLLGFTGFLFLGLALIKRMGAMILAGEKEGIPGRAWVMSDLPVALCLATSSGIGSVVVMSLYINSLQAQALYSNPEYLWFICPVLLWWYNRLLILAHRGRINDDPLFYAINERASWLAALIIGIIFWISI